MAKKTNLNMIPIKNSLNYKIFLSLLNSTVNNLNSQTMSPFKILKTKCFANKTAIKSRFKKIVYKQLLKLLSAMNSKFQITKLFYLNKIIKIIGKEFGIIMITREN